MPRRVMPLSFLLSAVFIIASAAPARATFDTSVTATVTQQTGGIFLYSYSVANLATSTTNISEFDIDVATTANLASIMTPTGFLSLYTPGDTFIQFLSTDVPFDVKPGNAVVFSFTSLLGALLQPDLVRGYNADGSLASNAGRALAPVPEPSSVILMGAGGALLLVAARRRGRLLSESAA